MITLSVETMENKLEFPSSPVVYRCVLWSEWKVNSHAWSARSWTAPRPIVFLDICFASYKWKQRNARPAISSKGEIQVRYRIFKGKTTKHRKNSRAWIQNNNTQNSIKCPLQQVLEKHRVDFAKKSLNREKLSHRNAKSGYPTGNSHTLEDGVLLDEVRNVSTMKYFKKQTNFDEC